MPGHGHRDGHVDADHADLDATGELARHISVPGKAGDAVAKLVCIDEIKRLGEVGHPHAGEHGPEDFFFVDLHLRADMVEQRAA